MNILLVEDDEASADLGALLLRSAGHDVEVAASVPRAVDALTARAFDLALVDLNVPGGGGPAVLETIRDLTAPPVVIIVSASARDEIRNTAKTLGAAGFIDKPIDISAFATKVSAIYEGVAAA